METLLEKPNLEPISEKPNLLEPNPDIDGLLKELWNEDIIIKGAINAALWKVPLDDVVDYPIRDSHWAEGFMIPNGTVVKVIGWMTHVFIVDYEGQLHFTHRGFLKGLRELTLTKLKLLRNR